MKVYSCMLNTGSTRRFAQGLTFSGKYPYRHIECSHCGTIWDKDESLYDPNYVFEILLTNTRYPDFLSVMYHKLLSENGYKVLREECIRGFEMTKVDILSTNSLTPVQMTELR